MKFCLKKENHFSTCMESQLPTETSCEMVKILSWVYVVYGYVSMMAGEGNGNPLQYSCLENLRDGGA